MKNNSGQDLKLLTQELKNPSRQLNLVFILIGVIPVLSCLYLMFGHLLVNSPIPPAFVPILFFSNLLMLLGYFVAYQLIQNMIRKILSYSTRARLSEQKRTAMAVALAHDLKSPLATIKANMANLKEGLLGPLDPRQMEMANVCSGVTERTADMLMDLIKTYSPNAGPTEMEITRFDLNELAEEQCRELTAVASAKKIEIKPALAKSALIISGDRSMVLRVIQNLLSNAIKYTPRDGKITLRTRRVENLAQLDVLNTGASIPETQLEKIFENYERLENVEEEGQGLGLGIARAMVEAHHGKIWAESAPGKPNCFTVLLPMERD